MKYEKLWTSKEVYLTVNLTFVYIMKDTWNNLITKINMENYSQLCVWPDTNLGIDTPEEFEKIFLELMQVRLKYCETVITLPTSETETGGRTDLFFYVHDEDVSKFAIPRLQMGIRWWEDVVDNIRRNGERMPYSQEILKKYPYTWSDPDLNDDIGNLTLMQKVPNERNSI